MLSTNEPTTGDPYRAGPPLNAEPFYALRQALILDWCKWDPQVGDVSTLARFPLIMPAAVWRTLASLAENLAGETLAAEVELASRPDLHSALGLSRPLRRILREAHEKGPTPDIARTMRFDFHWTYKGWRISEVNSDVPGGYCEGSELPRLMAAHYPNTRPAGHPGNALTDAILARLSPNAHVALLAAAGYIEDQQVVAYLAKLLAARGLQTTVGGLETLDSPTRPNAIVRFIQAEWLNPRRCGHLFMGGHAPVCNPCASILTESKRFPLVWPELRTQLPTWRQLLPETRDPREAPWQRDDSWLLKTALCNTGDTVSIRGLISDDKWQSARRAARWRPGNWIAQRRFNALPLDTPDGPVFPCIGVYVIDGRAAGVYARFAPRALIDFRAVDVAVLIDDAGTETTHKT